MNYSPKLTILFNFLLLLTFIFIKSNNGYFLDGVPWNNQYESLLLLIILPLLTLINIKFLNDKLITIFIIILILLKLFFNNFTNEKGLYLDAFFELDEKKLNVNNEDINKYNINYKTFNSIWNKNNTARITYNLKNKGFFPIDFNRGLTQKKWNNLINTFILSGRVNLNENNILIIETNAKSNFENKYLKNKVFITKNLNNFLDNKNIPNLNNKIYENLNIKLEYSKSEWYLNFYEYNIKDNKIFNPFNNNTLLIKNNINHSNFDKVKFLHLALEILFIFLFLFWLYNIIKIYSEKFAIIKIKLLYYSIITFFLPIIVFYTLKNFNLFTDLTNIAYLGFGLIINIFICYLFFYKNKNLDASTIKFFFIVFFATPILFYFFILFKNEIYEVKNFSIDPSVGNDWSTIFNISKIIAVFNDHSMARYCLSKIYNFYGSEFIKYIQISEVREAFCVNNDGVYHHNPLYRYICVLFFSFFGHGMFSIIILDVWSIILINFLCLLFLYKYQFTFKYYFFFIFIYLSINFIGPSRYLIGRGKEEFLCCLFIILSIFFALQIKKHNYLNISLSILSAIIALHLRLDKVLILLSLVSYFFEPVKGTLHAIYLQTFNIFTKSFKFIFSYGLILLFSLIFLYLRNYILLGESELINQGSVSITLQTENLFITGLKNIYYVLSSADAWPDTPKFPSIVLTIGSIYLISLFFYLPKSLQEKFCPSISLTVLIVMISFVFFLPAAYPPRWSTHLLPFSIIGFIYLIYVLEKRFKKNYL